MLPAMPPGEVMIPPLLQQLLDDCRLTVAAGSPGRPRGTVDAVGTYLDALAGPYAEVVGRLRCPVSLVADLRLALDAHAPDQDAVAVGLVSDTGLDGLVEGIRLVDDDPRLEVGFFEFPLRSTDDLNETIERLPAIEGFVDVPLTVEWQAAVVALADSPYGVALPTSGTAPGSVLADAQMARYVEACVTDEVPFICSAGVDAVVRTTDPGSGLEQHGILNLLLATQAATQGATPAQLLRVVSERDEETLLRIARDLDDTEASVARSFLISVGTVRTGTLMRDLQAWELLPPR